MNPVEEFKKECLKRAASYGENKDLSKAASTFMYESMLSKYPYNFSWLGCPIIQYPQDIMAMQEIIWKVKPDLIIETGIAHGGSLIFYASMMELICGYGIVVGVDIDIRKHNRVEIESHRLSNRIKMIEGSSVDDDVIFRLSKSISNNKIMVILDSLHTHDHVLEELELYSPMVTIGSYLVVCDTIIEQLPGGFFADRPWDKGDNPHTAVTEFLDKNDNFEIDTEIDNKLLISVSRGGYLKRIK